MDLQHFIDMSYGGGHTPPPSQPSTPDRITNMRLMLKYVVDKLSPHWVTICDFLEYTMEQRNWFAQEYCQIHKKCLIAVLEDWISSDRGRAPKTWLMFITILSEIDGLQDITRGIRLCLEHEGVLKSK